MTEDEAKRLSAVIETTMQVIVALRWAAHQGAMLPESLDTASQEVLDVLYEWQRRRHEAASSTSVAVTVTVLPDDSPPAASACHRVNDVEGGLHA